MNKIAFVIHGLATGGAEKFLINIVNYFQKEGYIPIVILLSEEKMLLNELNRNIKVFTILRKSRFDLTVSKRIKNVIMEEEVSKVFCVNTFSYFLTKLSFLFSTKKQFYLSLHSTIPASSKVYWQNLIYFRLLSKNDKVIYLCNNQKQYLHKKYCFSHSNDCVIYNGINTEYFKPELFKELNVSALRKVYSLSERDSIIIEVARLSAEKGHICAIEALDILHRHFNKKETHLLLVGGGNPEYIKLLMQYADEKGLSNYVHFTGNQTDVRKYYCISDIFTLTSYTETFSLAALEAMAFNLPCSLTNIGGAREMTIEGVTGLLTKPRDAVSIATSWYKLLGSGLKGERIRQHVLKKFTSEKMLQQYHDLICA
jgi:glycosyltransferase involved in cell wall biosynthesis